MHTFIFLSGPDTIGISFSMGSHHCQYKALPFGLSSVLRVITTQLHQQGITIFPYIQDWLLVPSSKELLLAHFNITIHLLDFLMITINYKNSYLLFKKRIHYIGAVRDSDLSHAFLPMAGAVIICLDLDDCFHSSEPHGTHSSRCMNCSPCTALEETTTDLVFPLFQSLEGLAVSSSLHFDSPPH